MRFFFCWLACLTAFYAPAQAVFKLPYTDAVAYSAMQTEPFHFLKNAASLAWNKNTSAGFYGERRFALSDLFFGTIAAAVPAGNSYFGFGVQSLGGDALRHSRYSMAYAHALSAKAAVGASFSYQQMSIAGYESTGGVGFSAGAQMRFTKDLLGGFGISNTAMFKNNHRTENAAPLNIDVGFGYDVSEAFCLTAIITKTAIEPISVQAACQYLFDKKLLCRIGIETASPQFFIGGGFLWGAFRIDAVGSMHPQLGFTPSLQLIYHPKPKE